jgi:hypothetical protein
MEKENGTEKKRDWIEGKKDREGQKERDREEERAGQEKDKIKLKTWFVCLCSPALFSRE